MKNFLMRPTPLFQIFPTNSLQTAQFSTTNERKIKIIDNKSMNWVTEISYLNNENNFLPLFICNRPHLFKHKFNQYFPLLVFGGSITKFGMHLLAGAYIKSGLWFAMSGISLFFRRNIVENAKIVVKKMDLIKCGTVVRITDMLGQIHEYPVR